MVKSLKITVEEAVSKDTSRKVMLYDLKDMSLPMSIVEYVAKASRSNFNSHARKSAVYDSLNDKAVKTLHDAFVTNKLDVSGKFLQLRLAKLIFKNHNDIVRADIESRLRGKSKAIHEIDFVGFNTDNQTFIIGEAKARKTTPKDYVLKWKEIVEDLLRDEEYGDTLYYAYFVSSASYPEDTVRMIKDSIDSKGNLSVKTGILSSKYITMYFLEEREGKTLKIYPK